MPFQEFAAFFGPDELEAMTAAYNAAWYQLWLAGIAVTLHPDAVRKKLGSFDRPSFSPMWSCAGVVLNWRFWSETIGMPTKDMCSLGRF
jgi:hypothetical protein